MNTTDQINEFLIRVALEGFSYPKIAEQLGVKSAQLTEWEKEHKTRYKELAKVRQIFLRKGFKNVTPREFLKWYEESKRECHYCKITESEIAFLKEHDQIKTKRYTTRGRKLEIERRAPNEKYDNISNLTFCCYWCNNAKSDEFTETEFIYIGQLIGNNWRNRIRAIKEKIGDDN